MPSEWNEQNAAHLLRRAGFGATPKEVESAVQKGFEKTLAGLLKPETKTHKLPKSVDSLERLQAWWISRMLKSKRPLAERLTLFWHDHFATAISKVSDMDRMQDQINTLRLHAMGGLRELLLAVSRDPAMLIWLDNCRNYAGHINENYARELMEIFTTGVLDKDGQPNYSEADVVDVARAFTGWTLNEDGFIFWEWNHDHGSKSVKGVSGDLDGTDVIDILVNDPATARRIPQKLFSFFAYPVALDDPLLDEFAAVYVAGGAQILPIVEAIFRHDAFYSPAARRALVKSPVEFLVGSLRLLRARLHQGYPWHVGNRLQKLGQSLYNPPTVFGWNEGLAWVATSGLLARADLAEEIADAREKDDPFKYKPQRLLGKKSSWKEMDAALAVHTVLSALDLPEVSASTRAALEQYCQQDPQGQIQPLVVDDDFVDTKVRGLVALILSSPEYQMA